ncbi:MAG: cation:proton antiporter [Thermoplasmata archaeon]
MAGIELVFDLAVIMLIAAGMTILFSWLKQPLILGYLLAGILIGIIAQPFQMFSDTTLVSYIAEIGIVFLMFTLGLEFTLGRLKDIGLFAIAIACIEVPLIIGVGFWTGQLLGFPEGTSLLLGAILADTSSAIIAKTIQELRISTKDYSKIVVGVTVVEDMAAVIILGIISGLGTAGSVSFGSVFQTIVAMVIFLIVSMAIGLLFIPRFISRVAKTKPGEVLLIVALGICLGLAVLSSMLGFSIAIGAFIAGMLIGESKDVDMVQIKATPLREMFAAVFFVTMGLMFDPTRIDMYIIPALVIFVFFALGKGILIGAGTFIFGFPAKTAFLTAMSVLAVGEFSLIICRTGVEAGLAEEYLYSITVLVVTITSFTLPLSIKNGEKAYQWLSGHLPRSTRSSIYHLERTLVNARRSTRRAAEATADGNMRALRSLVDVALISIAAITTRILFGLTDPISAYLSIDPLIFGVLLFVLAAAVIIPPVIDLARNIERMIEMVIRHAPGPPGDLSARRRGLRMTLRVFVVGILCVFLILIIMPWAVERSFYETLSPLIFLLTLAVIALLAWYMNKTLYRSFCDLIQRDVGREQISVGAEKREPGSKNAGLEGPSGADGSCRTKNGER